MNDRRAQIEWDAHQLAEYMSDIYAAILNPDTAQVVYSCEGDLIRAAATLNAILDECRQARRNQIAAE